MLFNEFQLISCRNVFIYFEAICRKKYWDCFIKAYARMVFYAWAAKKPSGFLNSRINLK